jgi:hypothetical protein
MNQLRAWLHKHTYPVHVSAFALMVISSFCLYLAARGASGGWMWVLLGLFILGNLLELAIQ